MYPKTVARNEGRAYIIYSIFTSARVFNTVMYTTVKLCIRKPYSRKRTTNECVHTARYMFNNLGSFLFFFFLILQFINFLAKKKPVGANTYNIYIPTNVFSANTYIYIYIYNMYVYGIHRRTYYTYAHNITVSFMFILYLSRARM